MRAALALLLCWPLFASAAPRIAIIIDDLGYHRLRGEAIAALPGAITCAVIPETPYGPRLADACDRDSKEVIIHLPMETASSRPLDKGGIKDEMSEAKLVSTVREAFIRIPQARGLNNHMGSVLTAEAEPMSWLMQELANNHYFFIDSRTTPDSVAESTAVRYGLLSGGRDVFLDNERSLVKINQQFNQLLRIAKRRGSAIAIGHPYPETIQYLQGVMPLLKQAGVELVPASRLLHQPPVMTAQEGSKDKPGA